MSAADGLRLATQWAQMGADRERQKIQDARQAEIDQRQRDTWAREDTARADSGALMDAGMKLAQTPQTDGRAQDFLSQYGMARQKDNPFAGANQQSAGRAMGLDTPRNLPSDPRRDFAVNQMQLARANNDTRGFSQAQAGLMDRDNGSQAASIYKAVYDATPDKIAAFASKYTDNANIPGSIKTDPKTGLMTLSLEGGTPIAMDRGQAATFVSGLWKLNNGDQTGATDLAGINKDLGALADKQFGRNKDVAHTGNDAAAKNAAMSLNAQKLELMTMRAQMGLGGRGQGAGGAGGAGQVGLKDRRDMLGDYGNLLPDPRSALDPALAQKQMGENARSLQQADAIFSLNAATGQVLTAPQILAAQSAAGDPKNISLKRDTESGTLYKVVSVSGRPVVVGTATMEPAQPQGTEPGPPDSKPQAAPPPKVAAPPEIAARMQQVISDRKAKNAAQEATATAERDAKQALTTESSWLTQDAAKTLSAPEALKYLRAYERVLDPQVAKVLRSRM